MSCRTRSSSLMTKLMATPLRPNLPERPILQGARGCAGQQLLSCLHAPKEDTALGGAHDGAGAAEFPLQQSALKLRLIEEPSEVSLQTCRQHGTGPATAPSPVVGRPQVQQSTQPAAHLCR